MSSHSTTRSDSASSMAKTPSDLSDQDSLNFISVDLVSAARKNIQLMRAVYESQWLRSRSALLEAVRRYEELWLPLISEFTAAPMILPPFDIEWVWFCHTLDQIGYRRYCELRFSKLIGKSAIFDEENEEYALMRCREIWSRMYPAEPLENQFDSLENSKDPISLNEDLVRAVLQHTELYSRFFEPYRCELVYLIAAKQRYKRFLHLLQGGAGACLSLVPASDISLMLLSHQSYPTAYARDGKEFESGLGKMVGIWMLPKPAEVKETKMLWDKAYNQPYEKAGGEIVVESENPNSAKLPVYWDVSDVDVSSKYRSLSPRFLLEVIVLVRLAHDRAKVQPDMGRDSLRLRMIRSHKELKIDKPVSSFPSDSWEKIWHLYPEFGTKGITLELRQLGTGCFKGNAAQETFGIHWNELLRAPSLTIEKVLERRVRVVVSVTPPIQAPYLLKCVPDKVTDDSGDMVCDEILKMNNYKPQEGRWLSRTVLDHAGRECFVLRLRVASGFWRRGAEVPLVVKWEDMITEILQGSWSYAAGSIGRAPGKLAGTASPKELSEEHKASWYLSTGSELVISWDSSSSILSLNFHLKDPTANDLSSVKLLKGRRMQYNAKSQNQAGKDVNEEENDEDGEEDGFITLVRITEEYPKGKATALLNWKLLAVEVLPEEDVVLALLICISILRSASRMRKEDIGGLLIRRRLKETKLGLRDWGSVVVHSSVPVSSPHVQPWYYCNAKEVIASDRSGSIARLPVVVQSSAEGAESLYRKAILG
ncbi:unnamed protein product [Rhodiola kirilowii]